MKFFWGKKLYIEWCSSEERSGIAYFTSRDVTDERSKKTDTDKRSCPLCLGEEDVKHL